MSLRYNQQPVPGQRQLQWQVASFEDDFDIDVENEDDENERALYASRCESSEDIMAYADEPLADKEWLKKYEAENEENKRLEQELQTRLADVSLGN